MTRKTDPNQIRQHYNTNVLQRFMDEKQLKEFNQTYVSHLHVSSHFHESDQNDLKIAALLRKVKSYSKVSEMLGIFQFKVSMAVGRVGLYAK